MLMMPSAACGTGGNGHIAKTNWYGLNYYLHQITFNSTQFGLRFSSRAKPPIKIEGH